MVKLVLASGSKQRKDILDMLGLKYEIVKSLEEERSSPTNPDDYVIDLSKDKANSVANQLDEKAIIIAADSIIYMNNKIYEKPKDKVEAFQNLREMSGQTTYAVTRNYD